MKKIFYVVVAIVSLLLCMALILQVHIINKETTIMKRVEEQEYIPVVAPVQEESTVIVYLNNYKVETLIEKLEKEKIEQEKAKEEERKRQEEERKRQEEEKKKQEQSNQTIIQNNYEKTNLNSKYYIKINYQANVITVYEKNDNGKYEKPVKAIVCSTGTATPKSGKYPLTSYKQKWVNLFGGVYGQYGWQITGNILFHSVPYTKKYDKNSLEYWEYDKLGTRASAGCIRMTVKDTKWIYENCSVGTIVEFYASSNPGPLGKPEVKKISNYKDLRGWDPTDPDENNPWKNN